MSAPPVPGLVGEARAPVGAVAFADVAGMVMGVLIAARPGEDDQLALPLIAIAIAAGEPLALAAVGEAVSLDVLDAGNRWRWGAEGGGGATMAGELEVNRTDVHSDESSTGSTAATALEGPRPWFGSCRVSGRLSLGNAEREVHGTGLLGTGPALADSATPLTRSLSACLASGLAFGLDARRPRTTLDHASEEVVAWVRDTDELAPRLVAEPLLSTTYDAAGRPRHAGLELWMDAEAEFPRRAAGEALAATGASAGRLRWNVSFLSWTMEGHTGIGPYVVARREG